MSKEIDHSALVIVYWLAFMVVVWWIGDIGRRVLMLERRVYGVSSDGRPLPRTSAPTYAPTVEPKP